MLITEKYLKKTPDLNKFDMDVQALNGNGNLRRERNLTQGQTPAEVLNLFGNARGDAQSYRASLFKWAVSMPLAVIVTLGLGITMAGLIAVEFVPQDKLEIVKANINPVAEDIKVLDVITPPKQLKDIEVPPPPPVIGHDETDRVEVPPIVAKQVKLDVNLKTLRISPVSRSVIDATYQPLVRFPPLMPREAQRSGHCDVRFDVSAQGQPFNVEALSCSHKLFARNTVKSVGKWKYRPRIENGQPVTVTGVKTKIKFRLKDSRGKIIPE